MHAAFYFCFEYDPGLSEINDSAGQYPLSTNGISKKCYQVSS